MNRTLMLLMATMLTHAAAQTLPPLPAGGTGAAQATPTTGTDARASTLTLPYQAPTQASDLLIAQALPTGAAYVPGSSAVNGHPIPDPVAGASGTLYWVLPAGPSGTLTYRVTHAAPLAQLPAAALGGRVNGQNVTLIGTLDRADLALAAPLPGSPAANPGSITFPPTDSVIRDRDAITVTVVNPRGAAAPLTVNGEVVPESNAGTRDMDTATGTERVTYYGVRIHTGTNVIGHGTDTIRVRMVGPAARVEVLPLQLQADGATPVRVKLRVLDDSGLTTDQETLTIQSDIQTLTADASATTGSQQVALHGGEAILELPAQATPRTWHLDVLVGRTVQRFTFDITPRDTTVGIGHASVTLGASPFGVSAWTASGYYEGMQGRGKLYASVASRGLPSSVNPNDRYGAYGDASTETIPLQGIDPVAFRYEHPEFSAQYRAAALPITVFGLGEQFTALSARTRGDTYAAAFGALVPDGRTQDLLTPNGTRLLRLTRGPISPDSETLEVVTRDRTTGQELHRVTLTRFEDYVIDPALGTIELARPLTAVDDALNDVTLIASYRLADPTHQRTPAWGAEVGTRDGDTQVAAAIVHLDGHTTYGVKTTHADSTNTLTAQIAASGGVQASVNVSHAFTSGQASFGLRYRQATYAGLNAFNEGLNVTGSVQASLGGSWTAQSTATLTSTPEGNGADLTGLLRYAAAPWSFGVGARAGYGTHAGTAGIVSASYQAAPYRVDVTHTQTLTGSGTTTHVSASAEIAPNVTARVTDTIDWSAGQRASFGLNAKLGGANLTASYDLPTASGQGNRARFGADTTLNVARNVTLGLNGAYLYDLRASSGEFSVGTSLRYARPGLTGMVGADIARHAGTFKTVLRAGITGTLSPELTLSADALTELGATPGTRASVSAAYRSGSLNALGYLRYQSGSLGPSGGLLTGELTGEYHQPTWAARGGVALRETLNDPASFTWQPTLGATVYVTDRIGLGLTARALIQPATDTTLYGAGVEGSVRLLPGTWATLGYNPTGFQGLGSTYTKQGAYLRLDLILDEHTGGAR
ncbi:hypothetical protein LAJ19_08500 [Deinococcus taeanensis]|uniref:hypothetical protein n=1 Tax=Deinococcus taeanensis TaxID=2737050 RepID=UPI001CDD18FC|nr:hypothetical protein [Deinococcus taeanensis]UBV41691.1 hypothetical protein LAJ19_08500 [Deinococcus taeanensis]